MRLLVLPSWYPSPADPIKGCFFQEQARLVSDVHDVKVLHLQFVPRPSLLELGRTPIKGSRDWLKFLLLRKKREQLPLEEIFINPPLVRYETRVLGITPRQQYQARIKSIVAEAGAMIANGWKPDLIHAHSVGLAGLAASRLKATFGIPYVITEHMPFALGNYPDYMRADIRAAFSQADLVLSLGYDKVRQLAMSDIQVEPNLIYNFVDETVFKDLCREYRPGEALRLVSIGAASHYKDHITLLRAMSVLKSRGIPFTLTLAGLKAWGESYEATLAFIRDQGLSGDVTVIDRIDRAKVPACLADHNVFVTTSIQEGFPVSVLEALATGLYVVSTRHGGTEDILTPEMGSLVEIKNFAKIADRLQDVFEGKITYTPSAIRDAVVAVCGREAFKNRLLGYYEQVANRNGAAPAGGAPATRYPLSGNQP